MDEIDLSQFKHDTNSFTDGIKGLKSDISPDIGPGKLLYEDKYQKVYNFKAEFGSYEREYFVRESGQRAGLIALKDSNILLVRQYRLFVNRLSYEIPGGKVNEGERPDHAAVRECLEETGVKCINPRQLILYHLALDEIYNPTYIFYSNEISDINESNEIIHDETYDWEWVSLERCMDMIKKGEILDSFTIIGILSYNMFLGKKE